MRLAPSTRLGPYEIVSEIGAGGMGVVYKARDTRLGRDVAIKVLPPAFARDPDRLARFEREARAVAAINHPNILSVHDIGDAEVAATGEGTGRVTYMVTELLDGDTLRTRLASGALPARKAIDVAAQVARGLAAAHDRGIVHRDLKPENIVLLRDGHVKILDFGLAKIAEVTEAGGATERGPTAEAPTIAATDAGTIMGTVGYMAPEQVRGERADARTDLFALGAVLHELVSGRRAFARPTAAETMTAILREDTTDLTAAPLNLAPGLAQVVRHALEKDPSDRFQTARDFAFALRAIAEGSAAGSTPSASVSAPVGSAPAADTQPAANAATTAGTPRRLLHGWRELAVGAVIVALSVGAIGAYFALASTPAAPGKPLVFAPVLPWRDGQLLSPAVSPDGSRVAFIDRQEAGDVIVVRTLAALQSQTLKGTSGVRVGSLFWSPDGRSLGFCSGGKLKIVDTVSGKLDELADAPSGFGGAWGPDGTILFNPDERAPIFRISSRGGTPTPVTALDAESEAHRWPQFLPDGKHFVYMAWRVDAVRRQIRLASLDGGESRSLFESTSAAVVAGNYYMSVRDVPAGLLARAFNPQTFEPEGQPVPLIDDDAVGFDWFTGDAMLSASPGLLVYSGGKWSPSKPTWFARTGRLLEEIQGDPQVYYDPAISPDGTTLGIEVLDRVRGTTDLWTVDLGRAASSRVTSAPGFESSATWSPDGRRIAFSADEGDSAKVRVKLASGGPEEILISRRGYPSDWSRDGRYLLFTADGGTTGRDIWVYDFEQKTARALINSTFDEFGGVFSPDGKYVAYVSYESRDPQVYIQSFADATTRVAVTRSAGRQPSWSRTGKELFYIAPDTALMVVDVRIGASGLNSGSVGEPQALFKTNVDPARAIRNQYVVTHDGQKVMVLTPVLGPKASPLVGVLNWMSALSGR